MAHAEVARPSKLRDLTFVFLQVVGLAVATALGFWVGLQVIAQQRETAELRAAERRAAALQAAALRDRAETRASRQSSDAAAEAASSATGAAATPDAAEAPAVQPTSEEGASPHDPSRPFPEDVERAMMHDALKTAPLLNEGTPVDYGESQIIGDPVIEFEQPNPSAPEE